MKGKCQYPGCPAHASKTWALVPLCDGHHEAIRWETERFYFERIKRGEREHYAKIEALTPWGK
jgi:hypothetical protein